jgi:tripartite-type tricarboxylate transporter receptor subunit TctC
MKRRTLLKLVGAGAAAETLAIACGGATTPSPAPATPAAPKAATPAPTVAATPALDWPKQPITLIVPWAAGGDTDVPMRVVAEFVGKELGQPVVVQNVAGASGSTGTRQFKNTAKPDGYTLLSIHEHLYVNQYTGVTDYGPLDFEPVANIVTSVEYLMTQANAPWADLKALVAEAKTKPDITFGVTFGSTAQLFAFNLMHKSGAKFKPVGYEGTAQRVTALLGDQIKLGGVTFSVANQHIKAGRLKALGYAWTSRDPKLSTVPTFIEQGVNMTHATGRGWVAPKGTDPRILKKVEEALGKVATNAEFKKKIEDEQGSTIEFLTREKYIEKLKAQDADIKKVVQETGMKATP